MPTGTLIAPNLFRLPSAPIWKIVMCVRAISQCIQIAAVVAERHVNGELPAPVRPAVAFSSDKDPSSAIAYWRLIHCPHGGVGKLAIIVNGDPPRRHLSIHNRWANDVEALHPLDTRDRAGGFRATA